MLDKIIIFVTFTSVETTIYIPLKNLNKMKNQLDIFSSHTLYDEKLLKRGIYSPLPIHENTLIWGFPIIRTARRMELKELSCIRIYDKNPLEHLELAVKLENRQGSYSWEEKVKIYEYLQHYKLADSALPLSKYIEKNGDSSWIKKARIYKSLSKNLKEMINRGHIDFKTASLVKELDDRIFSSLKAKGHFSFTERRLFLTYFFEVVKRDNLNNSQLIETLKSLLSYPKPLEKLKELRFPELSKMEKRYKTLCEKYIAKGSFKMAHPPYFEGDSFSITFFNPS